MNLAHPSSPKAPKISTYYLRHFRYKKINLFAKLQEFHIGLFP